MVKPVLLGLKFNLQCQTKRDEQARVFVARCPALNVYSQGTTKEEAKEAIRSAVRLFIAASYKQGSLEHTLKALGFIVSSEGPSIDAPSEKEFIALAEGLVEEFDMEVPLSLISQEPEECQR